MKIFTFFTIFNFVIIYLKSVEILIEKTHYPTFKSINISVYFDYFNNTEYRIYFGDGNFTTFNSFMSSVEEKPIIFNYSYSIPQLYTIIVNVTNSSLSDSDKIDIIVQHEINQLQATHIIIPPRTVRMHIFSAETLHEPTNVTCMITSLTSENNTNITKNDVNLTQGFTALLLYDSSFNERYKRNVVIFIKCNNQVSSSNRSYVATLEEAIKDVSILLPKTLLWTNLPFDIIATAIYGTNITLEITIGNNYIVFNREFHGPGIFDNMTTTVSDPGIYSLRANFSNSVNYTITYGPNLIVQSPITIANISLFYLKPRSFQINIRQIGSSIVPTNVSCRAKFGNESTELFSNVNLIKGFELNFTMNRIYNEKQYKNITILGECSNLITILDFQWNVTLIEEITGLNVSFRNLFNYTISVNRSFELSVEVLTGDDVQLFIFDGDNSRIEVILDKLERFNHSYPNPGIFTPTITVNNTVNELSHLLKPITVQVPIYDLKLTGPNNISIGEYYTNFTIMVNTKSDPPTDVFCSLIFLENSTEFVHQPDLSKIKKSSQKTIQFNTINYVGFNRTLNLTCKNLVSTQNFLYYINIYEKIENFMFTMEKAIMKPFEKQLFLLNITSGSFVKFQLIIGYNLSVFELSYPNISTFQRSVNFTYYFKDIGNYTVKAIVENGFNRQTIEKVIIVQNVIENVTFTSNKTVFWTPGIIIYELSSLSHQSNLTNIYCTISFNNVIKRDEYIPLLEPSQTIVFSQSFSIKDIGTINTTILCRNLISEKYLSTTTKLLLDEVIISYLLSNDTATINNYIVIEARIKRMAKDSCFVFDLNTDNPKTKFAYGISKVCRDYALVNAIDYKQIDNQQDTITFNYQFIKIGTFNISLKGFNSVSEDYKWTVVNIIDLSCSISNVTFPNEYLIENSPKVVLKSHNILITPLIRIDCQRTKHTTVEWKLFNMDTNNLLYTTSNSSVFIEKRTLNIGQYKIQYFIHMTNFSQFNHTYSLYFNIEVSPLYLDLGGKKDAVLTFGEKLNYDSGLLSYDPDNYPDEKLKGILFKYFCKQKGENYLFDEKFLGYDPKNVPDIKKFKQNGGCFGHGPGFVGSNTDGKFTIDSLHMLPNRQYFFQVRMVSNVGNREKSLNFTITIPILLAPRIEIRCISNCQRTKTVSKAIKMQVQCFSNCFVLKRPMTYKWTLYQLNNGQLIEQRTKAIINQHLNTNEIINFLPNEIQNGFQYNLKVEGAFDDVSENTSYSVIFLINRPPYGGSCGINPLSGKATIDLFDISCHNWKEFETLQGSRGLLYEFKARPKGADVDQNFLLHSSYEPNITNIMLPLGDDDNHLTEIEVLPPSEDDNDKVLETSLNVVEGDKLKKEFESADYTSVSATLYSVTSVLNENTIEKSERPLNADEREKEKERFCDERAKKMKIRRGMVDYAVKIPLKSTKEIEQNNEIINKLVNNPIEVDIPSQEDLAERIANINEAVNKEDLSKSERDKISIDLIRTTAKMTIAANNYREDVQAAQNIEGNSNGEDYHCDNIIDLKNNNPIDDEGTNTKLKNVMGNVVNVVESVTDKLLESSVINKPINIELDTMDIHMEKTNPNLIKNTSYDSQYGSFELHSVKTESISCIGRKLILSNINPYMWHNSSEKVTSTVATFQLNPCDNLKRKKRNTIAKIAAEFSLSLNVDPNDVNQTLIIVVSLASSTSTTHCSNCTYNLLKYGFKASYPSVKKWNGKVWNSCDNDDCKFQEESLSSKVKFKSNLLGSLGTGLDLAPNTIDFEEVFTDLGKKLADNAAVFGTICALIIIFFPLAIMIRRLDLRDEILWQASPLVDNHEEDKFEYEVHVFTGNKRKAATTSHVYMIVYGTDADTGRRRLASQTVTSFKEGSMNAFKLTTPFSLGSIVCLKLYLRQVPTKDDTYEPFDPWFVSRIVIIDKASNVWYNFDCDKWLSDVHYGSRTDLVVLASRNVNQPAIDQLFKRNLKQRITDDHLWISIGARRTKSRFTRLQRFTVCYVALFLSMIASCMFYKEDGSLRKQTNSVTISLNEFYVGLANAYLTQYEDHIGEMNKLDVEHLSHIPKELNIREKLKKSQEDIKKMKYEKMIKDRMNNMIKDIVLHSIFLILVTYVCFTNQSSEFFYQNRAIKNTLVNFTNVTDHSKLWKWTNYDIRYTTELNHMRFSSVRLFQQRVQSEDCKIYDYLEVLFEYHRCFGAISDKTLSTQDYSPNWDFFRTAKSHVAFSYSKSEKGYSISLGRDPKKALDLVRTLKRYGWTDRQTRILTLDLTILNHDIISQAVWKFKMDLTGGILTSFRSDSLILYRYTGAIGVVTLILEILSLLSWLSIIIKFVLSYYKDKTLPGIFLILSMVFFTCSIGFYTYRTLIGVKAVEDVMNSKERYVDLSYFFNAHYYFIMLIGISGFFGELHLLSMLKISRTISVLVCTLKKAGSGLLSIAFCTTIIFIGYSCWGYVVMGSTTESYKSFKFTCYALIDTVFGHLDFVKLSLTSGTMGKVFIISYGCVMIYLILNIFITTLNGFLVAVKTDPRVLPVDHEVFQFIIKNLKTIIKENLEDKVVKKTPIEEKDNLLSLLRKTNSLEEKIVAMENLNNKLFNRMFIKMLTPLTNNTLTANEKISMPDNDAEILEKELLRIINS
ncbi:DgyrCDS13672 [Dimorphilus gyrociliatus]|uniref:DgyrCDS13672 n=1 Tax=Dimorphilus gyrociliatus TaxID=2664684 RepID=A0A7I8WBE2_9ANNE|nr:DgyrCDS13672 [Dimorphilus gyrociliatus]